jgi:hypothetical protein
MQPQTISLIINGAVNNGTSFLLTSSGVFVDTQTITIGGVVFTTVTALSVGPAVAGEVVLGASAAATLTNLTAAINAPTVSSVTFTALSAADASKITTTLGLTATTTATVMTLVSSNKSVFTVSETETNAAWTISNVSRSFGPTLAGRASVQLVASSVTSGNAVFTVDVSNDGVNWTAYNRMTTNATNTNGQTDTRVASVTLSADGSSIFTIPDPYALYRVRAIITTDGIYNATAFTT